MQIKEFEALTLKECLEQVRSAMGPDAVILETKKVRKGGVLGVGAHDAVAIVAATGITVDSDSARDSTDRGERRPEHAPATSTERRAVQMQNKVVNRQPDPAPSSTAPAPASPRRQASPAALAARGMYGNRPAEKPATESRSAEIATGPEPDAFEALLAPSSGRRFAEWSRHPDPPPAKPAETLARLAEAAGAPELSPAMPSGRSQPDTPPRAESPGESQTAYLERAMNEIRQCLTALQHEQKENYERTVSAVVSAVAPAITAVNAAGFAAMAEDAGPRFPELQTAMREIGVSESLVQELMDRLPDMSAWSEQAQQALAISALRDLIARRVVIAGPIELTPGRPKTVALIGPTGVGKTTTIAKLAANFALLQNKRVALVTVDTYRIAAVEQLKTYSQIIGLPVSVAYRHAEVPPIIDQYSDFDLILIDTAGRSQQHAGQVGELKSLLEGVACETHLVLSAQTKEQDMIDAARRFAAARVDRLIFSKLDETLSYGTLLNVSDQIGIPLSYFTTGQKVPEDIEQAAGSSLASLILDR